MAKLTKKEQQQYDKCLGQCSQCYYCLFGDCKLRIKIKDLRILSAGEKLDVALRLLDTAGGLSRYHAECERREKDGG